LKADEIFTEFAKLCVEILDDYQKAVEVDKIARQRYFETVELRRKRREGIKNLVMFKKYWDSQAEIEKKIYGRVLETTEKTIKELDGALKMFTEDEAKLIKAEEAMRRILKLLDFVLGR